MSARFLVREATAAVAARTRKQEGVLLLRHLTDAGLSERQVEGLVANGELWRPYKGVLIDTAVPVTPLQSVIAASFALGPQALASHRLCLFLWDLSAAPVLEFSVLRPRQPRLAGVKTYRVSKLPPRFWGGLVPVTSPMRGLLDTAAVAPEVVPDAMVNAFLSK